MALTPSTMLPLGTAAPDFSLTDTVSGKKVSPAAFKDRKALLVMFICNHCPYVKHLKPALVQLGKDYEKKDVGIVAISSNDPGSHPDDAPEKMAAEAGSLGYKFPYLFDETQAVAKAYKAACTPDFFVFDAARKLAYRGQFDASRPGNNQPVTGADLRGALDAVIAGKAPGAKQTPSLGCNIKWRAGSEPEYFLKG
jgi:thiol-disulfide isomerase/thioredoxin